MGHILHIEYANIWPPAGVGSKRLRIMKADPKELRQIICGFGGKRGATIPVLQAVQEKYGHLPVETFSIMEEVLGISASKAYGVATFFAQFRLTPYGKNVIKMCNGTACHVKGAETLLSTMKEDLGLSEGVDTTSDGLFTLEEVACLGCCSLAPVMMIGDTTYGDLNVEKIRSIIGSYKKGGGADE